MADKTYTEDEHLAVLESRLARETADLTENVTTLTAENGELNTKLDVATAAQTAAEQRATQAETDLAEFKASIEAEREAASRKDERITAARAAASHLAPAFFEDETRVARIVAMTDEAFTGYVADLTATNPTPGKAPADLPRETAIAGDAGGTGAPGSTPTAAAGRSHLLRGFLAPVPDAKEA